MVIGTVGPILTALVFITVIAVAVIVHLVRRARRLAQRSKHDRRAA